MIITKSHRKATKSFTGELWQVKKPSITSANPLQDVRRGVHGEGPYLAGTC